MKLSIIIPCYNERHTIRSVIQSIRSRYALVDIIVVDDASTDGSNAMLNSMVKTHSIRLFVHDINKGKGAAIRTGIAHIQEDVVLIQDADLEYSPADYPSLVAPILNNHVDVVYGSRFLPESDRKGLSKRSYFANKTLTFFSNCLTGLGLSDMETCYKVFRRSVIESIDICENGFGIEPEITAKIAKKNNSIIEVPIQYNGRNYAEGKKIRLKDAVWAVWCIIKYRFW